MVDLLKTSVYCTFNAQLLGIHLDMKVLCLVGSHDAKLCILGLPPVHNLVQNSHF